MSHSTTKPTKWHVRPANTDQPGHPPSLISLRCPHEESLGPWLSLGWTAKTLIGLGGCPGWSESSLDAHVLLLVLSWGGTIIMWQTSSLLTTITNAEKYHRYRHEVGIHFSCFFLLLLLSLLLSFSNGENIEIKVWIFHEWKSVCVWLKDFWKRGIFPKQYMIKVWYEPQNVSQLFHLVTFS